MRGELVSLAQQAGKILMKHFRAEGLKTSLKADDSPVTEADLASHEFLHRELTRRFNLPVVSEEGDLAPQTASEFFLVDPLDGTKDFLNSNPEFSICIALIKDRVAVAGVIHGPAVVETYSAIKGEGAFAEIGGDGEKRLPFVASSVGLLVRSRFHDSPYVGQWGEKNGFLRSVTIGSALKYGALARGEASVYPRFTNAYEWDIAAGDCILTEAGGSLLEIPTLAPPRYGRPGYTGPGFIACSPGLNPRSLDFDEA